MKTDIGDKTLEGYYLKLKEPHLGAMLALRDFILSLEPRITTLRKYQIPFFYYNNKNLAFIRIYQKKIMFGTVWKKHLIPGTSGKRPGNYVEWITIDPAEDLPVEKIGTMLFELIRTYKY